MDNWNKVITVLSKYISVGDIVWMIILIPLLYKIIAYLYQAIHEVKYTGVLNSSPTTHFFLACSALVFFGGLSTMVFIFFSDPLAVLMKGQYAGISFAGCHLWIGGVAVSVPALFSGTFAGILFAQFYQYLKRKI
jgi:hypothetical protein